MVARGLVLDHARHARRVEAGEQNGGFDLRRGDWGAIFDRRGIARALEHDRAAPACRLGQNLGAHEPEWIEDAPHRPLAQRGVAVEGCGHAMAADDAHHQPAAGAGVAEIERLARRRQGAEARPANSPLARPEPLDDRAERLARLARPQHVVALEQPLDFRFAAGEKAEQKRAMRDRLVPRRPDPPFQRPRALGGERRCRGKMRRMSGHETTFSADADTGGPRRRDRARITGAGNCRPPIHIAH